MKVNLKLILNKYQAQIPEWINIKFGDNSLSLNFRYEKFETSLVFKKIEYKNGYIRFEAEGTLSGLLPLLQSKTPDYIRVDFNKVSISLYQFAGEEFSAIIDAIEFNKIRIEDEYLVID